MHKQITIYLLNVVDLLLLFVGQYNNNNIVTFFAADP